MESIVSSEILEISIDVVLRYDCNSANVIDLQLELDYQIKVIEIFKIDKKHSKNGIAFSKW